MAGMSTASRKGWGEAMSDDIMIRMALSAWQKAAAEGDPSKAGEHLAEETLYRLAMPGGLQSGADKDLQHLSLCPECQEEWISWLDSLETLSDEQLTEEEDLQLGVGFLKAASSPSLFAEPVSLESACKRFELAVYPELDRLGQGMVVIEVKRDENVFEGKYCTVRGGTGGIILQGRIEDSRLAGRISDLSSLDLKTWTVTFRAG